MNDPLFSVLTPVRQALLKIAALRDELQGLRASLTQPIAIVGIGFDAVERFNPGFFGIPAREARPIDPPHRQLLDCSRRAVEDAQFSRDALQASRTRVFVGFCLDDGARIGEALPLEPLRHAQTSLRTARAIAAGRIAYLFRLHRPTLPLDTAGASSLAATHLACQSLRSGECDLALAGAVHLILSPEMTLGLCEQEALSHEGRCKSVDAGPDGSVRSAGCGMLALMRLSDARTQRRPIRALIRGSAVQHEERRQGLTTPSGRAQREVIREALAGAGVNAAEVDYVEAQGTGTLLGDPIELRALHEVYVKDTGRHQPLHIGSLKTAIGPLEGSASGCSLIKVVGALQHGELPAHLHFHASTPSVDWRTLSLKVVDQHMPWPSGRPGRRVAAISSFGLDGTNAHAVLEAWTGEEETAAVVPPLEGLGFGAEEEVSAAPEILPVSARMPGGQAARVH
ncbi:polyketide synthase [Aquabacterium sp. A7-Y]|uniref:beta-ketoacyl [acyl carrier protein] synthase domain-containing protein n=1 Tax=Aquabacterium sp. A7-Y TaxID=1349605 RepID=UPI00223E6EAB|nr:polyketide synthase [Aquabacterium sp. A7-Y]MCW7538084.1 polyketide synthase [Aquabacterium sp. A7-Y]